MYDMGLIPGLPDDLGLECLIRVPYERFSSVASVCRSWKREIELPEFWRRRKGAGATRRVVVMAQARIDPVPESGSSVKHSAAPVHRLTICEPETGDWAELPPPTSGSGCGLPLFCQVIGVGLNLVVIGGLDPVSWEVSRAVFIYNFVSATWRRGANMPGAERSFFACSSDNDQTVYIAGGHDKEKCALKSAMTYNVAKNKWTVLPDMARERDESKGVFYNGKFQVIGGYHTNMQGGFEASVEAFDPATWQWGLVQDDFLETAMCPKTCTNGGDGKLYMLRGSSVTVLKSATWQVVAEVPSDIKNTAYVCAWKGTLFVIGSARFGAPHKAYLLDLKNYKWRNVETPEEFSGHVPSGCCLEL